MTPGNELDGASVSSMSANELDLEEDDVAIIGFSCRVPGGNDSPSQLWSFLMEKGDASGEIPKMRWEPYNHRQPGNAKILSETTSKGYFLNNLEDFDASFFGISPREAEQMDPQQRIAVEVAWEALENSGIPPQSLAGSDTAVFMGVNSDDYSRLLLEDLPNIEAWMGVGTAYCGIPNRISYLLDLMGPSSAIDAACASSLVAVHHGRQALLAKETGLVIAGGVNALIGPGLTRVLDNAGALSADGRCRSFNESAAGYGRSEGAGIVILRRLSDAIEAGDRILAVLKGSAVGADGRTNGIMAPNQYAQERVARQALKAARISADTVSYVEAHATSTSLGDPTECAAMANVYGSGARQPESTPCYIGSIKSNIGHLEAGAGVMGLIKAIMVLQEGVIPPQANLVTPNPKIDWEKSLLKTAMEPTPLPTCRRLHRAAVASYGYGGTVSHAVIEAAPLAAPPLRSLLCQPDAGKGPIILLLSAPQASRIMAVAAKLAHFIVSCEELRENQIDLDSISYTLAVKRGHHKFRAAIVAESQTEAVHLLNELAQDRQSPQIYRGYAFSRAETQGTVWLFSGHGAQWKQMGHTLLNTEPAFEEVVKLLEPIVEREMGFSAMDALRSGDFESTDKAQVLTYIMQTGLAAVLKANGLQPQAVIGHSHGEIAASVVAGALNLSEGAMICCIRARLYRTIAGTGAMVLVNMPFSEAVAEIGARDDIAVAINSSPTSCVVSGTLKAVEDVSVGWKKRGLQVRTVQTDIAFHSPLLLPLVAPLRERLKDSLRPRSPVIPLYSTSTLDARSSKPRDSDYWIDNMVNPVLLTSAISAAVQDGFRLFVEVSSHPIITHSVTETLLDCDISDGIVIPTLFRNQDTQKNILLTLGKLHCHGVSVDFKKLLRGSWLQNVPGTVWEHKSYWRQVTTPTIGKNVTHDVSAHVLLGERMVLSGTDTVVWQTYLDAETRPFPGRHPLHGTEIIPAAVLLNTFLSAAPGHDLHNVSLRVPVVVGPQREVQVILDNNRMKISSRLTNSGTENTQENTSWLVNTTSQVSFAGKLSNTEEIEISGIRHRLSTRLSDSFSIEYLAAVGVSEMGFPWRVDEHFGDENEMLAKVRADPEARPSKHWNGSSWASILDAATSISSTIFFKEPLLRMPTAIGRVSILSNAPTPEICYIHVQRAAGDFTADIRILGETGSILVDIQGLKFAGIEGNTTTRNSHRELVHRIAWPPARLAENPLRFHKVVFIADKSSSLLQSYEARLLCLGVCSMTIAEPEDLPPLGKESIVIFIADIAKAAEEIYQTSARSCDKLLSTIKALTKSSPSCKAFCITQNVSLGVDFRSLSQAPLLGLARIIQSEEPEVFGSLIDVEDDLFPMQAIKYVQGVDVIRIEDSVARTARLRPFAFNPSDTIKHKTSFHLQPQGTYVITGGLGALGLEVAFYLAEKGAKRLVLVSRRRLPARYLWEAQKDSVEIQRILYLEAMGLSVYPVAIDMTASDASSQLQSALDNLLLPPVLGVVHAAGTLANQVVAETTSKAFDSVISPKIIGAMALHEAFPPETLDFMVLFSSCGQLLGFPGQAAYASGNAFLDALATHRRNLGDNTISMMWTSWRGLGMAASTRYIDAELHARGITDITRNDAFLAWEQIFRHDTDHAVILRTLPVTGDTPSHHPILDDILVRQQGEPAVSRSDDEKTVPEPTSGPELQAFLTMRVKQCVAATLSLSEDAVDSHVALSELGMDSVMAVGLRTQLQNTMGVKVGPTLIWNCPTVSHLAQYFVKEKTKAPST